MNLRTARYLVLATALSNAILYCCALPLWEGFDEVVHYGYVETLLIQHRFPVLNETRVSKEIRDSLYMTPLSHEQCESLPGSVSFEEWARMGAEQKQQRKADLVHLPQSAREQLSEYKNYEAQQAPLAYLLYVPLDLLFGKFPLPARVLSLRLCGAILSCLLLYSGAYRLLDQLDFSPVFRPAMLATALVSQMLWAAIAHVGNDVLAIPLTVWFFSQLAATVKQTTGRNVLILGAALGLGLITKAYFLAFAPVFLALLVFALVRRAIRISEAFAAVAILFVLAGPWYWHNVALYRSISGTQQSVAGIGLPQAIQALPRIHWVGSIVDFSHWSLWTGNYSFLSFSKITLDIEIWLLLAAMAAYWVLWQQIRRVELWLWVACGCFALSLIYQTCVTWIESHGLSRFAEPWYAQGVIVCVWALCFVGLARWRPGGRWIAVALVLISAWIAAMTYSAKLLPYYAGGITRGSMGILWKWWASNPLQEIASVTMVPAAAIYCLLGAFYLLLLTSTVCVVRVVMAPFLRAE